MVNTEQITAERLEGWRNRLREEKATPIVLIGVGHDEKSGQLVLCTPEGVDDELLIGSLRTALACLLTNGGPPPRHGGRVEFKLP